MLTRCVRDGRAEIDDDAVKREVGATSLGRENYLFAGFDVEGERAADEEATADEAGLNSGGLWRGRGVARACCAPRVPRARRDAGFGMVATPRFELGTPTL